MNKFFSAVIQGDLEEVKTQLTILEDEGADVDITFSEKGGKTALFLAVKNGHYHLAEYLLSKGAKTTTQYEQLNTIVHVAVESPDPRILELLLQYDAFQQEQVIDTADADGSTPLHRAVKLNKLEMVRLLVRSGANISLRDLKGREAISYVADVSFNPADDDDDNNNDNGSEISTKIRILLQSAQEWSREFAGLNLSRIMHYLDKGLAGIEKVKENDIFLVIGNTGSGKSTLINYAALNVDFKASGDTYLTGVTKPIPIDESKVGAKIGYSMTSETISAALYQGSSLNLLDCPGFIDNRGEDIRVSVSMNTRIAIQQAKSIKGVAVVIDVASLEVDRGNGLIELSKTLGRIFKNPTEINKSLFFIYTKAGNSVTRDNVLATINKVRQAQLKIINGFKQKLGLTYVNNVINTAGATIGGFFGATNSASTTASAAEQEVLEKATARLSPAEKEKWRDAVQLLNILDLMRERTDESVVVNLFSPTSREEICNQFMTAPGISKEQLNFGAHDDIQGKFDRAIFKVAENGNKTMGRVLDINEMVGRNRNEFDDVEERIAFYDEQIKQFRTSADRARQIAAIKTKIEQNKRRIRIFRGETSSNGDIAQGITSIRELYNQIHAAENVIRDLDKNDLEILWQDTFTEKRSLLGFFGWSENQFAYGYSDKAGIYTGNKGFDQSVVKSQRGGAFSGEQVNSRDGYYQVLYQSGYGNHATASVRLNIAKKLKDPNPAIILAKKLEIVTAKLRIDGSLSLQAEIDNLELASKSILEAKLTTVNDKFRLEGMMSVQEEIANLETENERLHRDLGIFETSELQTQQRIEERIQEMEMTRTNLQARRNELNANFDSLQAERGLLEIKITENLTFFTALHKLISVVSYDNPLIQEFASTYDKFTRQNPRSQLVTLNDPGEQLITCPISLERMVDPVRAIKCGHSFDQKSILQFAKARRTHTILCPCCQDPNKKIDVRTDLQPNRDLKELIEQWRKRSENIFIPSGMKSEEVETMIVSLTHQLSAKEEAHRELQLQLNNGGSKNPEIMQQKQKLELEINELAIRLRALSSNKFSVQLQEARTRVGSDTSSSSSTATTSATSATTTVELAPQQATQSTIAVAASSGEAARVNNAEQAAEVLEIRPIGMTP